MCLGIRALTNWAVLHGLLSPLCGMLRRAATGIGASKTAIWPVLALGGERTHANQGVSLRMVIILFVIIRQAVLFVYDACSWMILCPGRIIHSFLRI